MFNWRCEWVSELGVDGRIGGVGGEGGGTHQCHTEW